jgi:hypothetical protein
LLHSGDRSGWARANTSKQLEPKSAEPKTKAAAPDVLIIEEDSDQDKMDESKRKLRFPD